MSRDENSSRKEQGICSLVICITAKLFISLVWSYRIEESSPCGDVEGSIPGASPPSAMGYAGIGSRPFGEAAPAAAAAAAAAAAVDLTLDIERSLESFGPAEAVVDNITIGDGVDGSDDIEDEHMVPQVVSNNVKKFVFRCSEGDCCFSSGHRDRFVTHLRCLHHLRVDERVLDFDDWTAFILWKEHLEYETHATFVKVILRIDTYGYLII